MKENCFPGLVKSPSSRNRVKMKPSSGIPENKENPSKAGEKSAVSVSEVRQGWVWMELGPGVEGAVGVRAGGSGRSHS